MKNNVTIISIVLIVLIGILFVLQQLLVVKNDQSNLSVSPSPTTFQAQTNNKILPLVENIAAPENAVPTQEAYEKVNRPDLFLSNRTPYENEYFSITYTFKTQPNVHFAFTTRLKNDRAKAQQEFTSWLTEQGLTNPEIATLDITYVF